MGEGAPRYCHQVEVVVMVPTWALLTPGGGGVHTAHGPSPMSSRGMLGTSSQPLDGESLGSLPALAYVGERVPMFFSPYGI